VPLVKGTFLGMFPRKGMLLETLLLPNSGGFPVTRGFSPPWKGGILGILFPPTLGVPKGTLLPLGKVGSPWVLFPIALGVPQGTFLPLGKRDILGALFPITLGLPQQTLVPLGKGGIIGLFLPPALGVPQGTLLAPRKGVPKGTLLPPGKGFPLGLLSLIPLFQFHPNGKPILGVFRTVGGLPEEKIKPIPRLDGNLCTMLDCEP